MADTLFKMRCVNPSYLNERYGMIKTSYSNRFKSVRPYRYHYVFIKDACHLYDTMDHRHDYQTINLETCGFKTKINIAIFVFFMHNDMKKESLPVVNVTQISHICNNRPCINPEHLNLETVVANNSRKKCKSAKKCSGSGHEQGPTCSI